MTRRKAGKQPVTGSSTTTKSALNTARAPSDLDPFHPASSKLLPFLETLPPNHVYLTSLDTTSPTTKRTSFLVPVVLNTLIIIGLCYRVYTAAPTYFEMIITIFGYDSVAKVDTANAGMGDLLAIVSGRTGILMMDYAIFAIIGAWPREFLFGSKEGGYVGPVNWRWTLGGFVEREVVVRRSRKWDKTFMDDGEEKAKGEKTKFLVGDDVLTMKLKITPAMTSKYLEKTGYAMLDRDWDLDFAGMVNAFQLIEGKELDFENFENKAFAYNAEDKKWLQWDVHKKEKRLEPTSDGEDEVVQKFRDKLVAMGHEDLFYRWIELVQYESSVAGGFTAERQASVMRQANELFKEKQINFDKFLEELGGRTSMPGLGS